MLALMMSETSQPDNSFSFTLKPFDIQPVPEKTKARICPECSTPLKEINFAYDSNVMIDKCPACKGVWLDRNEIYAIAEHVQYKPEAELMGAAICDFRNKLDELKDRTEPTHDVDSMGIIRSAKIITAAIVRFLS